MATQAIFAYLEEDDANDFREYLGTENEELLVAGSRTPNRLERYLPKSEMDAIRVFFTAIVRDFKLPSVRFTFLVAVAFYKQAMERRNVTNETESIVNAEFGLAMKHLMDSEKSKFANALDLIVCRWDEYVANPSTFVL